MSISPIPDVSVILLDVSLELLLERNIIGYMEAVDGCMAIGILLYVRLSRKGAVKHWERMLCCPSVANVVFGAGAKS